MAVAIATSGRKNKKLDVVQKALNGLEVLINYGRNTMMLSKIGYKPAYIQIALIALEEYNALYDWCKGQKWPNGGTCVSYGRVEKRLLKNLSTDVRIVMRWDNRQAGVKFMVRDPDRENWYVNYYERTKMRDNGVMMTAICGDYCISEFQYKKAPKGMYTVTAEYGSDVAIPPIVSVIYYRNWGHKNQTSKTVTMRLDKKGKEYTVGQFVF